MPIYEYLCPCCQTKTDEYRKMEERHRTATCSNCKGDAFLTVSIPANSYVSGYPYFDPVLSREVGSPGERKRLLKENKLEERG